MGLTFEGRKRKGGKRGRKEREGEEKGRGKSCVMAISTPLSAITVGCRWVFYIADTVNDCIIS